VNETTISA